MIFNLGPMRFVAESLASPQTGRSGVSDGIPGIEEGWPAAVKLPHHTEYEVQYSHLRQTVRWLGFQERYLSLPQFYSSNRIRRSFAPAQPIRFSGFARDSATLLREGLHRK